MKELDRMREKMHIPLSPNLERLGPDDLGRLCCLTFPNLLIILGPKVENWLVSGRLKYCIAILGYLQSGLLLKATSMVEVCGAL